jgi:hypothetical protein
MTVQKGRMKLTIALAVALMGAACSGAAPTNAPANSAAPGATAPADTAASVAQQTAATAASAATTARPAEPVAESEVTIPSGTTLRVRLLSGIASDENKVEDAVRAEVRQAVVVKGQTVIPEGAELSGTITDVDRSGRVKGLARIAYRFTSLSIDGRRYDIRTAPIVHQAEQTKGEDAKKIAIGAGAGAAVGALLGGGSGAAKGAAIGGAGGTGAVLATRGKEVRIGSGAAETVRLAAPVTVRARG